MAVLEVTAGPRKGSRLSIEPGERPTLGRDETSDFLVPDQKVSRRHCEVFFAGELPTIRDLASKNGTFVNDSRVGEIELKDGDIVRLGECELRFSLVDSRECFCCRAPVLAGEEVWAEGQALCPGCGREYASLEGKVSHPLREIARRRKASRRIQFDGLRDSTVIGRREELDGD